jgi:predicted RNA-binding Zn-ribbon protein involved in translation (DUF1610 family)
MAFPLNAYIHGAMNFVPLYNFANYIDAHIVLGKLESEDISCWLKDEHTVTVNPIWTNAVGGIKLMVAEAQVERARELLIGIEAERKSHFRCPQCGSNNIELVSTPRKTSNWLSAIVSFFLGSFAIAPDKVYHCFACGHEAEAMDAPVNESL